MYLVAINMILFSWPVDQIVVDFTLPGHWCNTVFSFTIELITFLDSSTVFICLSLLLFCLLKYFYWTEFRQPLGIFNPAHSSKVHTYCLLLANRSKRMPTREACRIYVV